MFIELKDATRHYRFLETGDVYEWKHDYNISLNQIRSNPLDGSLSNIYLRRYENGEVVETSPLMGIHSNATVSHSDREILYEGEVQSIQYKIVFSLEENDQYLYTIELDGQGEFDLIYALDVGIADQNALFANELYVSQYIDHKIFEGKNGYVLAARQNLKQGEVNPYFQMGSLGIETVAYSTDATQFFGLDYKKTNIPYAYSNDLKSDNYQYEMTYFALQSKRFTLNGCAKFGFYGLFQLDHPEAIMDLFDDKDIENIFEKKEIKPLNETLDSVSLKDAFGTVLQSEELDKEEIDKLYPHKKFVEKDHQGHVMAFFDEAYNHIVLANKDLLSERPHGHIISSLFDTKKVNSDVFTSTNYIYGVFAAQTVVGNTSFNKLSSTTRWMLNNFKNSGRRMYVRIGDEYHLLALPAVYEMGLNYSKWIYKIEDDLLEVRSFMNAKQTQLVFEVISHSDKKYDFLVTEQTVMGEHEFLQTPRFERQDGAINIYPPKDSMITHHYENLHYEICFDEDVVVSGDEIFFEDNKQRNESMLSFKAENKSNFKIVTNAYLDSTKKLEKIGDLKVENDSFEAFYRQLGHGFHLSLENNQTVYDFEKLNAIFKWYSHNAMVHYAVPHGLEQPGGAAWGTRDICQGPFEYFITTGNYEVARAIILRVFEHQFKETGEWPQWFMFDRYSMQQDDSHGDIVFWPIKIVGDYLSMTNDLDIFNEKLVYRSIETMQETKEETLLDHIKRAVSSIEKRFIGDSYLITYAGGDWDDTLQPASKELAERLVSSWTMGLAYQSLEGIAQSLKDVDASFSKHCQTLAEGIKSDFRKHMIKDGVIAGFVYINEKDELEYMLHPEDSTTGINYRLLPMTRSIIANLVDNNQALRNIELIDEHLRCPDGVRLMNRPARYTGGVSEIFQRAEQASNVGREISLQYVHAHIRYIEAMAKFGHAENVWDGIYRILPIRIQDFVKNANIRQSNAYFSSSEGAFKDRYDYQDEFERLRTGDIPVKGGWRIYSSGPGIYLNQLISNALGLRYEHGKFLVDPILIEEFDGLKFQYHCYDKPSTYIYHIEENATAVKAVKVNGEECEIETAENAYRDSGVLIRQEVVEEKLNDEENIIEIILA